MHNHNFVIISSGEAHMAVGRLNAISSAQTLSGADRDFKWNTEDKKEFDGFLEAPVAKKLTVYGPIRTVTIYPIAASN